MNRVLALQKLNQNDAVYEAADRSTQSNLCSSETNGCSTQSNSCSGDQLPEW
jgi:hypothetical protein